MHQSCCLATKVDTIIKALDFSTIAKNDKVAIKMHLGFKDGYQTIPVFFVRRIVDAVKQAGGWPFITDNPTAVYNAYYRGYTQETCGCPLIPAAGVKDGYVYETKVGYGNVETLDMGGVLHDADVLIDLSHAKGHNSCGYGGAFKNLALGGYSAPSRWNKIHGIEETFPYWDPDKCTPDHARELVSSCPYGSIKYDEKTHKLTVGFSDCYQCMECIEADKSVGCLRISQENFSAFQSLLAHGAKKVLETFDDTKKFFLTFLIEITPFCDCWGLAQPCVVNDIGVLGSRNIVAIETATLDLIKNEGIIEKNIPLLFKHANLDPGIDLHPFQRLFGPMKNPYLVTQFAEKLGMGSRSYELVEVLPACETVKMEIPEEQFERQPSFY
ncbi:MAG: DUF362 domain-containing protein [Theionarchaea archaeon]|nr:DUF362 domain-containing protein [Theionarchaea archaeon]